MARKFSIIGDREQQKRRLLESVNHYLRVEEEELEKGKTKKTILTEIAKIYGYSEINSIRNNIGRIKKEIKNAAKEFREIVKLNSSNSKITNGIFNISKNDINIEVGITVHHDLYLSGASNYDFAIRDYDIKILSIKHSQIEIYLQKQCLNEVIESISNNLILSIKIENNN